MSAKTPLSIVKEKFGEKSKLVEAVKAFTTEALWLGRLSSDRGNSRGLEHVSNAKLLRLHATFSEVKAKFGSRAALIGAILENEKRSKDEGFKSRLERFPVPRLYDAYKSSMKRAKANGAGAGEPSARAAAAPAATAEAKEAAPVAKKKAAPKKAAEGDSPKPRATRAKKDA